MMQVRSLIACWFCFLALSMIGCGANLAPVLEVHGAPVVFPSGMAATAPAVRDAILRALADRGWTVGAEQGADIVARVTAGGHWATVRIQYSPTTYSVTRLETSPSLKFDGQEIHRRYNLWISRLRASIDREISHGRGQVAQALAAPPAAVAPTPEDEVPPPPPPDAQ